MTTGFIASFGFDLWLTDSTLNFLKLNLTKKSLLIPKPIEYRKSNIRARNSKLSRWIQTLRHSYWHSKNIRTIADLCYVKSVNAFFLITFEFLLLLRYKHRLRLDNWPNEERETHQATKFF